MREILPPPSADLQRLDKDVLLMTAVLWIAFFGVLMSRSVALGENLEANASAARLIVAFLGAVSSLIIYVVVQKRRMASGKGFLTTFLLSLPVCAVVAVLNELTWLFLTDYYPDKYGVSPAQLFTARAGAAILEQAVYTAAFFLWVYVAWCALYAGAVSTAELRERDRRLAAAETAAQQAQVLALRLQLNPHFMFNTLNTLSGLIAMRSHAKAEEVILNLSSFLRYSLTGASTPLVPLGGEIEAQRMYLDIEKTRFEDRLRVDYDVDPDCEQALVPSLILQPLVENAMKHGVAPSAGPVTLTIGANRADKGVHTWIENSAGDRLGAAPAAPGLRIGLENVRKRLLAIYGEKASFAAGPTEGRGWRCDLYLPWSTQWQG